MPAPTRTTAIFLPPRDILTRSHKSRRHAEGDGSASSSSAGEEVASKFVTYHPFDLRQLLDENVGRSVSARPQSRRGDQSFTTLGDESTRDVQHDSDGEEGTSLAPPPSFQFALNRITPVSELFTNPDRFLGRGDHSDPFFRMKINLLVLVREVGPIEQYEIKNRDQRAGGSRVTVPPIGYRSHLIVCDRDESLLKVMLWDRCAQIWADPADEEDLEHDEQYKSRTDTSRRSRGDKSGANTTSIASRASQSMDLDANANESRDSAMSETLDITTDRSRRALPPPRSLRPGDVVYLSGIVPSRSKQRQTYDKPVAARFMAKRSEEGTGASIQCSTSSDSTFQLCFRGDTRSRRDQAYAYVGSDGVIGGELEHLAGFDAHCKAILALARLWR